MAKFTDYIKSKLRSEISDLMKSDGDSLETRPEKSEEPANEIGRKAIIEDPFFDQYAQHTIFKHKRSRLSNKMLKDVSVRDWATSSIIQSRCDTMLKFSRVQYKRFDTGFKILKRDLMEDVKPEETEEMAALQDFLYHCGRVDNTPADEKMLLGEFLKLTTRDALTFGHIAIEKVKTRRKSLHRFRPLPAEQVYHINKKSSKKVIEAEIKSAKKFMDPYQSDNNPRAKQEINEQDLDYYKYIQVSADNRTLGVFGDEDMIFKLFNPQNFADSMGYCYSPVELSIINITNHLNVENYNAKFFTHGYAARGVLHLKGTVTQSQLTAFRRQFHNTISGVQNSWRTPIIAGLDDVQFIGLSGSAREMEYIAFNDHILRAICAQFQIDPVEIGLDYLSSPTGKSPMQQANNEYKIEASKERGLHPILMFYEDFFNCDIIPMIDPSLAKKYIFKFVGYTDQTPLTEINQLQAEMTVHSTMNDILKQVQKNKIDEPVADLPMNQAFWALIEKNYTRGEIRERFFKDKGASKRKELQYIPGDPGFLAWQQLTLTVDQQREANKQQAEMATREQEAHEREGEAHDAEIGAHKDAAAHAAVGGAEELKATAKEFGAGSKPLMVDGQPVANPINKVRAPAVDELVKNWIKKSYDSGDKK